MIRLRSEKMKKLLKKGLRKAKNVDPPREGMLFNLYTENSKNGWYYQIDYVYDLRFHTDPYVVVFAYSPQSYGNLASHCLYEYDV